MVLFGVAIGSTSPEVLAYWRELGVNMITAGQDYGMLQMAALDSLKRLKAAQGQPHIMK